MSYKRLPVRLTVDSSVLVKALAPPRRRKRDNLYQHQLAIHRGALAIFEDIIRKNRKMFIPSIVLIEVAAVISRITNNREDAYESVEKIRKHASRILYDSDILDSSVASAVDTKASGFDNIVLACARLTGSALITDDLKLHRIAEKHRIESYLLRELL